MTPEHETFIRQAIESGRFYDTYEAMKPFHCGEGMNVNGQICLPSLDEPEAALARGGEDLIIARQSMRELAEKVKRSGQVRLATGRSATR